MSILYLLINNHSEIIFFAASRFIMFLVPSFLRKRESIQEWKAFMRIIKTRAKNFKGIVGRIVVRLIFFSLIVGLSGLTAFGDDHGRFDRGRYDRGRFERRGPDRYRYEHGRRVYRPYGYGYRAPIYVPPPVIYEPPPPGITIFLPPFVIR